MLTAIIQSRLGSHRLPRKSMMDICGKPMLGCVIDRVRMATENIIIATPDKEIAEYATSQGVGAHIGNEDDVLDRYYQAAKKHEVSDIVRITADNPLVDSGLLTDMIVIYKGFHVDYLSNTLDRTYPKGLDIEIFSFGALKAAWLEAREPYDREHVTPFMYNHPKIFKLKNVWHSTNLSHLRWTVDYPEDLDFVRDIYSKLGEGFTMNDVLKYLTGGEAICQSMVSG